MKKGQETGLTIIISVIVLIIIILQSLIFFVFLPRKNIQPNIEEYIGSEMSLDLIAFARSNSNLIVQSVGNNDYSSIEEVINNLDFGDCWEIKINEMAFNKNKCSIKNAKTSAMSIPDYNNNQIRMELNVKE